METCLNYTDTNDMFFSSTERKWITKIRKLQKEHPEEVTIIAQPEDNGGCIYAKMPSFYLKIQPKKRSNFTDEQILNLRERGRKLASKTNRNP